MSASLPCNCGCSAPLGAEVHRVMAALLDDDLDGAIRAGLLADHVCDGCSAACTAMLLARRNARQFALAARERFRAREARLAQRQQQRIAHRSPVPPAGTEGPPALPTAAAAALARAKAKAAGRQQE
jgi:hypothetical protein